MAELENERLHATVEGRVQGVGFRAFVQREATDLGLSGWVRNRHDGTVELAAEGPRPALDQLVRKLQSGPGMSYVADVRARWEKPQGESGGFRVRFTG